MSNTHKTAYKCSTCTLSFNDDERGKDRERKGKPCRARDDVDTEYKMQRLENPSDNMSIRISNNNNVNGRYNNHNGKTSAKSDSTFSYNKTGIQRSAAAEKTTKNHDQEKRHQKHGVGLQSIIERCRSCSDTDNGINDMHANMKLNHR